MGAKGSVDANEDEVPMSAAEAAMVKSVAKHFVDPDAAEAGSKKRLSRLSLGSNFSLDSEEAEAVALSFTRQQKRLSFTLEGKAADAVAESIAVQEEAAAEVESSGAGSSANSNAASFAKTASFAKSTPEKSEVPQPTTDVRDAEYRHVLAHCAKLRQQREQLLNVKWQVRNTIAQFSSVFAAEGSETPECSDEGPADEQDCDLGEAEQSPSYEEALAEAEELEDEVETLREALDTAATMVANLVQKSQEWSEHLDGVESQIQLPAEGPANAIPDAKSNITFAPKERMELPALNFLATPGAAGSTASSATATPRSETDSPPESRMAFARIEKNVCISEAKPTRALGGA